MPPRAPFLGLSAVAMAIGFNLPYANRVAIYDYPDILRRPAAEALSRYAEAGPALVLTWQPLLGPRCSWCRWRSGWR